MMKKWRMIISIIAVLAMAALYGCSGDDVVEDTTEYVEETEEVEVEETEEIEVEETEEVEVEETEEVQNLEGSEVELSSIVGIWMDEVDNSRYIVINEEGMWEFYDEIGLSQTGSLVYNEEDGHLYASSGDVEEMVRWNEGRLDFAWYGCMVPASDPGDGGYSE